MAYIDSKTGKPELFRIGEDDKPYIPSLFYISSDGEIFCGDDAIFLGKDDPSGLLDRPLKRSLRELIIIAGNGHKTTPKVLLQTLFGKLREKIQHHPDFSCETETKIVFTIPAQYGPSDEMLIRNAAVDAGFPDDGIVFVPEPVAAAFAWFAETNINTEYIVVLDCGGGTLDWTCLRQSKPGNFQLIPELPPDGDIRIGGYDIDEEIFKHLISLLDAEDVGYCRVNKNTIIRQIQNLKEKYSKTNSDGVIQLENKKIKLTAKAIEVIVKQRFINQVLSSISPFIDKVKVKLHIDIPDVLLVGGSSGFILLRHELESTGMCNPIVWERSEYATVLGGVNYLVSLIDQQERSITAPQDTRSNDQSTLNLPPVPHNKDYFRKRALDCYKVIISYYEDDAYIKEFSDIPYLPSITAQNYKSYIEIVKPLWSDILKIFGFELPSNRTINNCVRTALPELVSDLSRDYMQISEHSVFYKAIAARTITLRIGIVLSMITARSNKIQGINLRSLSTLVRKLCVQPSSIQPATPEKEVIVKLVEAAGGYSVEKFNETIEEALSILNHDD